MGLFNALKRLLPILAIIGLIAGAGHAPTNAMAADSPSMTMTDAMDCCPDRTAPACGKACPLMVMCFAPTLPAMPAAFLPVRLTVVRLALAPHDESLVVSTAPFPLRRPPRI